MPMISHAVNPRRGEIWLVNFDPSKGAEIQKERRALVVNPTSVGRLPLRIIVPLTEWKPSFARWPWFVHIAPTETNGITKEVGADAFQVKSVSLDRFTTRLGAISLSLLQEVAAAIALCVGYQGI